MAEPGMAVQRAEEPKTDPKIVKSESLAERVNSVFDEIARRAYQIFEGHGSRHGYDMEDWFTAEHELLVPVAVEVTETDQAVQIQAQVQGFDEKELQVSIEPQQVTITGKHETSKEQAIGQAVYSEAMSADILRVVALPAEVDAAKATTALKNGVLTITVPKSVKAPTAAPTATEQRVDKIANQMEAEMEQRDKARLENERDEQEDLNQGMSTGTYDSARHGANWPASFGS